MVLPLLETDLLDIIEAVLDERLDRLTIRWKSGAACCVVAASGGYPAAYQTDIPSSAWTRYRPTAWFSMPERAGREIRS